MSSTGFCSLECGAKIVAWIQVVGNGIATFTWGLVLITGLWEGGSQTKISNHTMNETRLLMSEQATDDTATAAYSIAIVVLFFAFLFHLIVFILAFALLKGLYNGKMSYVAAWLVGQGILLGLTLAAIIIRVFALLFNIDSNLTYSIIWFVLNTLQVWVVYVFWSEKKNEYVPA